MLKFNGFVYLLGGEDVHSAIHDDVYIVNVVTNRTTKGGGQLCAVRIEKRLFL